MSIVEGVHQIREPSFDRNYKVGLGMYLLADGEEAALIDSGIAASPSSCIIPYLKERKVSRLAMVINTHGHEDHVGGNWELKQKYNPKILIHRLDAPWAEDPDLFFREFFAQYPQYLPPTDEVRATVYAERGRGCAVDLRLYDGQTIEAGGRRLQVIHTPGHSAGSICLYDRANRILFSGDAFQGRGINTAAFPDIPMYMDVPAYVQSLRRISQMPIDVMLTAHEFKPSGSMAVRGAEVKAFISESLKVVDEIEVEVIGQVQNSRAPMDLLDIAREIQVKFAGPGVSTQALGSIDAHLRKLAIEKRIELFADGERHRARLI